MSPLHLHHLSAAEGWLELGDWRSALEELAALPAALQATPDVLRLRFSIHSAARDWTLALQAAEAHVEAAPDDKHAWINRSFALHELKQTSTAEDLLRVAQDKFPEEPIIAYNLACYSCVLGKIETARDLLKRACTLGDKRELQDMARNDPDLANLWKAQPGKT